MPADVEVMIVSYGSATAIAACLPSLERLVPGARVSIREHAGSRDLVRALEEVASSTSLPVRIEHDPTNPGFGAGCNALARSSDASWFVFLNPDTVITGWPWADDPPPTGSIVGPVFDQEPGDHYGRRYRIVDEIARSWLRRPGRRPDGVGFVSGAALLIDSTAFETIGGFDERYFLFYEDIEFCLRANRLGIPVIVEPGWTVTHERGHSTRSRFGDSLRWSYESACTFHADQHESLTLYRLYVAVDSAARAVVHRLRGRRPTSDAYRALARRAISDCARAFRSRP